MTTDRPGRSSGLLAALAGLALLLLGVVVGVGVTPAIAASAPRPTAVTYQLGNGTLSEVARVLGSGGDLSLTTGRVADTAAILDELGRLGFATTLGRAEGGIPWITGVLR